MKKTNVKFLHYFVALMVIFFLPLASCDDKDDDSADPGNGNGDNGSTQKWEPYDFQNHKSATMVYDFEFEEDGETSWSGTSTIEINDPSVTLTTVFNGDENVITADNHDNVEDNFNEAINNSPYLGAILYGGFWPTIFEDQELSVGASWSWSYEGNSINLEITGKEQYAGQEGYVAEYTFEYEDGKVATWTICVDPDIPLPLMVEIVEEGARYHLVMTDYQN